MRKRFSQLISAVCLLLLGAGSQAQLKSEDSLLLAYSLRNAINLHNETLGEGLHLYSAPQDEGYNHTSVGNPYFIGDVMLIGALFYDDIYYENVPMVYDLQTDNVLILKYSDEKNVEPQSRSVIRLDLIQNRISSFFLAGHNFVRLKADSAVSGMRGGFYDKLHDGRIKLFIKRTKNYGEDVKNGELERRYNSLDFYFIQKDGVYYHIRSKKNLLAVLKDKKSEISSFLRKNSVKFKKQPEQAITGAVLYYEQLNH